MLGIEFDIKNLANKPDENLIEHDITPTLNKLADVTYDY